MDEVKNDSGKKKMKRSATRGTQTLFRVTYRTQVNLIRIADNKAHIVIGINAMVISVLIGMVGTSMIYKAENTGESLVLVIPVVLIIVTAFFTAYFAILAAQPYLISPTKGKGNKDAKANLLFFENIWDMPTDEYIGKMESLMDSPKDLYQNMIIDIHNQAKVLHRKYRLLYISYVIFKLGYLLGIMAFLLLWLVI